MPFRLEMLRSVHSSRLCSRIYGSSYHIEQKKEVTESEELVIEIEWNCLCLMPTTASEVNNSIYVLHRGRFSEYSIAH